MNEACILIVEDDAALSEALADTLQMAGYCVQTADNGKTALKVLEENDIDLVVSDINMPKMDGTSLLKQVKQNYPDVPIMLMTAYGSIEQAVDAIREGAMDYLVKPFEAEVLVNMVSRYIGSNKHAEMQMIVADEKSKELARLARRLSESDATVMITGESGVGKEVLAQYIHQHSLRKDAPFVAINCAAIPENMLEATMFGYEKGAYTGAYKASPGKFEQAQGGTILLDEISEMDLGLQAKLLRVLQEKEVERLGGNKIIDLDVRVLATSNQDMRKIVAEGRFREDLFYRLNVFPMHIEPLRNRRDDIIPLAERIIEKNSKAAGTPLPLLSEEAKQELLQYSWPGNIRELDNVIQRALILQSGGVIEKADLHFVNTLDAQQTNSVAATAAASQISTAGANLNGDLKKHEWEMILNAIRDEHGSRKATAERLGISQRTLRYKLARMREAGISIPDVSGVETA